MHLLSFKEQTHKTVHEKRISNWNHNRNYFWGLIHQQLLRKTNKLTSHSIHLKTRLQEQTEWLGNPWCSPYTPMCTWSILIYDKLLLWLENRKKKTNLSITTLLTTMHHINHAWVNSWCSWCWNTSTTARNGNLITRIWHKSVITTARIWEPHPPFP